MRLLLVLFLILFSLTPQAFAEEEALIAQDDAGAYDPFIDYSEFDQQTEEEADINFFRNGRFVTLGLLVGRRFFTEGSGQFYQPATGFGIFLSYFFDLRFALQFSFATGNHAINYASNAGNLARGNASVTSFGLNFKYYINTQNITRGLAALNPYVVGGFSQVSREISLSEEEAVAKEGTMAFDMGLGVEVPAMRNKMFFGAQLTYQLVTFPSEGVELTLEAEADPTGLFLTGDIINLVGIIGINF